MEAAENVAREKEPNASSRRRRRGRIALVVVAVVVVAAVAVVALFAVGVLHPSNAAAKYGLFSYVFEDDVSAYVETFKKQSGYGDETDEQWVAFLAERNLTPEALRASAINEALKDAMAERKAAELGIKVSEEEVNEEVDALKTSMAFGDDGIWRDTLAMYGQTEEGIHEKYRLDILKRKLCEREVPVPEPDDFQVKEYIASVLPQIEAAKAKHSYCYKAYGLNDEGSLEKMQAVQKVRDSIADAGPSVEAFAAAVDESSDVEELRATGGENGWDVDVLRYSDAYESALTELDEGGLSGVFNDGDGYAFIWVDEIYELPQSPKDLADMDLSDMPESLRAYFSDCEGHVLWQAASDEYLQSLVEEANPLIFPMPT